MLVLRKKKKIEGKEVPRIKPGLKINCTIDKSIHQKNSSSHIFQEFIHKGEIIKADFYISLVITCNLETKSRSVYVRYAFVKLHFSPILLLECGLNKTAVLNKTTY